MFLQMCYVNVYVLAWLLIQDNGRLFGIQILTVFLFLLVQNVSGYDGEGPDGDPPSIGGDDVDVCPYCGLSPCIISRLPNWLRGSVQASLNNQAKRFHLYVS